MAVAPARPSNPHHKRINRLLKKPWSAEARGSKVLREFLNSRGYCTPNFTWDEVGSNRGDPIPGNLRRNAIRHAWNLERFRHALGDVPMSIDGPYRTAAYNREIGGASLSRHIQADASDFFANQIDRWIRHSKKINSKADVLRIANRIFAKGGVGNENSGTLHVDSRGYRARFVTWNAAS